MQRKSSFKRRGRRRRYQTPIRKFESLEPRIVLDARLLITEFVASNDNSLTDEDGDDPDWIELFNAGQDAVNLDGWHLTDDAMDLGKSELGSRVILPGEYLIVFASGKDRNDPIVGNLHTNFRLSAGGEYLALTRPDESIAFEYAPTYPTQVEDVGYGIPSAVTQSALLSAGATAKLHVPLDGSLDPDLDSELIEGSWIDPDFDDSQWTDTFIGIGYSDDPKPGEGTLIADSVAEFSDSQGMENWRYGYWTKSDDNDGVYEANTSDFKPFIKVPLAFLNSWNADEMMWDLSLPTLSPQATQLRSDSVLPSGSNSGKVQHPIRRWESEISGGILIHGSINNPDAAGDGVIARILVDGDEVYRQHFDGNTADFSLLRPIQTGQNIDFVLDPGDDDNDVGDDTQWTIQIEDVTPIVGDLNVVKTLTDDITTDIGNQLKGIGSSAYLRVPFTPASADFDSLSLKVKYQDGFVAYLNGQEIARSASSGATNATWQTVSDSERTVDEATQFEAFNVTSALDLISPGEQNVLMVQAINISSDDDDLLLVPELVGTNLEIDETAFRYFQTATPAEQNGIGANEFGSLFSDDSFRPLSIVETDFVQAGDMARVFVPTNASVDDVWVDPAFVDTNTEWFDAKLGVGYEDSSLAPISEIADSWGDWSASGTQGEDSWFYGYYNETDDSNSQYSANDFQPFPDNYYVGVVWDWPNGNPPHTLIGIQNMVPNGSDGGDIHWPVRRYVSEAVGSLDVEWKLVKSGLATGGNGVTGRLFHNGVEVDTLALAGDNTTGVTQNITIPNVQVGDFIDFAVDPRGADGLPNGSSDTARLSVTIDGRSSISDVFHEEGDIGDQMQGSGTSAYLRIPFTVEPGIEYDTLKLDVNYDDGFVAFLNGQEIGSRNVSGSGFSATGATSRSQAEVMAAETIDLSQYTDLLSIGQNLLAIQLVNASAHDSDAALVPRLYGSGPAAAAEPGTIAQAGDALIVTAKVSETFHPIGNVDLHYRVMYGDESTVTMVDDGSGFDEVAGDNVYTGVIPGGLTQAGEMVRWYMTSSDAAGNDARFPLFASTTDSEQYFGTIAYDPSVESSNLPILHWFVQTPSRANSTSGTRGSLFYDGEFYDNVQFDIHGQSTRAGSFLKKSHDVDFPRDHRFRWNDEIGRMKDFNLLTNYADKGNFRNELSYEAWGLAGGATHLAEPVRVQQNGEFFAIYDFVEDGDNRYLERIGLDPNGALYKMYNNGSSASGNEKKTRRHEDISDLNAILDAARLTGQASKEYMFDNVDIPSTINFLAAQVVNSNVDCCHKNYYMYRDSDGTGKWYFLPWDADLSFGRTWTPTKTYFDDIIQVPTSVPHSRMVVTNALYAIPEFREMYMRRVRTLIDQYLQPSDTPVSERYIERRLDEILAKLDPTDDDPATGTDDADLDFQKWGTWGNNYTMRDEIASVKSVFLPQRRDFIYNTRTVGNGGEIPLPADGNFNLAFGTYDANPESGNQDQEFVEIVNNGNAAVDLTGWQIDGGIRHEIEAGTVISAGGSLYLTPDLVAFRQRTSGPSGGQGLFVQEGYNGHLSNFGETIELRDREGSVLASFTLPGEPSDAQNFLRISEIMYNPAAPTESELATDAGLENDDFEFVELVNTSQDVTLDLNGVRFSQGFALPYEFTGSRVTALAPGERVVITSNLSAFELRYGPGRNVAGVYEGGLSNSGENIKLDDANGSTVLDFAYDDSTLWPQAADGLGASLEFDLSSASTTELYDKYYSWRSSEIVGGSPGVASPDATPVVINEVLANTDGMTKDAIELRNTSDSVVDVGGWYLSDSSANLLKYRIPEGTSLPANGYLVFDESDFNPTPEMPAENHFALNGTTGDDVWLVVPGEAGGVARIVDDVHFRETASGQIIGLDDESNGRLAPLVRPTLGCQNSQPLVDDAYISVINHTPSRPSAEAMTIFPQLDNNDLEYLVVQASGSDAQFAGWRIRGGIDFDFPAETSESKVYILSFDPEDLANQDRTNAFRAHHGLDVDAPLIGGYSGSLNNSGDQIRLERPGVSEDPSSTLFITVDEVVYDDQQPWPPSTPGDPLVRISSTVFGNDGSKWARMSDTTDVAAADFNGDGSTDVDDLNLLMAAVSRSSQNSDYVISGEETTTDATDIQSYVRDILGTFMGDATLDGQVNATDLNQVGLHWQESACRGWRDGDFNGDGIVSAPDLNFVGINWQLSAAPRSNAIPVVQALFRDIPTPPTQHDLLHAIQPHNEVAHSVVDQAVSELTAERLQVSSSDPSTRRHRRWVSQRRASETLSTIDTGPFESNDWIDEVF